MQGSDERQIVVELLKEIGTAERHFNHIEAQYRLLCVSLLLATLGAIGYVFGQYQFSTMGAAAYLFAASIASLGMIGVFMLWNIDLRIYHRLLDSAFVSGLQLELENTWLPPSRLKLFPDLAGSDASNKRIRIFSKIRSFYLIAQTACGLLADGCLILAIFTVYESDDALAGYKNHMIAAEFFVLFSSVLMHAAIWAYSDSKIVSTWIQEVRSSRSSPASHS